MSKFDSPFSAGLPPSAPTQTTRAGDAAPAKTMKVTTRDRTSASLIAMLIMAAACVAMLFVIWVTTRVWIRNTPVAPELIEPAAGGGNALGDARELVEPGEEEVDDFAEPQLEETIDSITDAVTDRLATLDTLGGEEASTTAGGGAGDSRLPGPGDGESDLVPRWKRWEIEYIAGSSQIYARQLDAFGVELAASGGGSNEIDYVSKLVGRRPTRRTGLPSDDDRLYMTYQFGPLRDLDAQLLEAAGIKTRGRVIMQFYSPEVENQLATVEQEYIKVKKRTLSQVKKTTFGVTGDGTGYRYFVKQQQLQR